MKDFLLEISCEEIPASYTSPALKALELSCSALLKENNLEYKSLSTTGTPRRFALFITDLQEKQEDQTITVSGPPEQAAFKDGKPTKAAEGFAKKNGKQASDIEVVTTDKGNYCQLTVDVKGRETSDILAESLPDIIAKIPSPKSMKWLSKEKKFARPIRNICAMWDKEILPITSFGLKSNALVKGHPFISPKAITLNSASKTDYLKTLKEAFVIADLEERQGIIKTLVEDYANKNKLIVKDDDLIEEVSHMVEFPSLIVGTFDEKYLAMPACILETSMKNHQRYFPVYDENSKLTNKFLSISNRKDEHGEIIQSGNERVLRARLDDGLFFWESDCKKNLSELKQQLKGVVFYQSLGTYFEKVERVRNLSAFIAQSIDCDPNIIRNVTQASDLYKNDLVSEVVFEFTELQGEIGRELALKAGIEKEVAIAIAESYMPRFAGDQVPSTMTGKILSLAEKLDSLAGFFSVGKIPTGSQDPFALRRHAIGLIHILLQSELSLPLSQLVQASVDIYKCDDKDETSSKLLAFINERFQGVLTEQQHRTDCIKSILSLEDLSVSQVFDHLNFLKKEVDEAHFKELTEIVQRSKNISKEANPNLSINVDLLQEEEEKRLWRCFERHEEKIMGHVKSGDLSKASLEYVKAFRHPITEFFEKVYVSVDDEKVKNNRLAMLYKLQNLYTANIADLSLIQDQS